MRMLTAAAIAAVAASQAGYAESRADAARFRSPVPQELTAADVARFQIDPDTAAAIEQHRRDGYRVAALPADRLEEATAGLSSGTWTIIAVVGIVAVIAIAAGGGGGGGGGY